MPLILGFCLIAWANISAISTKRFAEIGHPCLKPLVGLKKGLICPKLTIQEDISVYMIFMRVLKKTPKFIAFRNFSMNFQFTVTKAFSKSMYASIPGHFLSLT